MMEHSLKLFNNELVLDVWWGKLSIDLFFLNDKIEEKGILVWRRLKGREGVGRVILKYLLGHDVEREIRTLLHGLGEAT